ncbi:3-(methylthio)propionyl-CoA ligase [Variovorax humicola]|uniref:3-(Methylthio)propionyl-CoA ligase n=1 Tax=Variovorax humicola TaxID=1769758 RepID=A0ABU8W631_9BURK
MMMDRPLLISSLIEFADRFHGDAEIVTQTVEGHVHRYTYSDAHRRAKQAANMLTSFGIKSGDRVATLAWNTYRHFELYYAISGSGAVCHTVNPRLFEEQVVYIVNHAQDRVMFFDATFAPLVAKIKGQCPTVERWIALTEANAVPAETPFAESYEALLAEQSADFEWPTFDENTASSLCYTSGTTGNPKGVLYSHRSTMLHAYGFGLPDAGNLSGMDVVLAVVPMFHANSWSIPYAAPMVGAKLVLPGARLDGASVAKLLAEEDVTLAAGVPTIWSMLLTHIQQNNLKFPHFKRTLIGGAACPASMIEAFDDLGVEVVHAWGMTETSPLGTLCSFKRKHAGLGKAEKLALRLKQGRPVFGVDIRIVDPMGKPLPHDGKAFGDLHVRGPWIVANYLGATESPLQDGWFPTGDVSTIDPDGYMQITDRSKDVIKSGGEWISSVELENLAVGCPGVAHAAAIGVRHPRWDERPLLIVQRKPGAEVDKKDVLAFLEGKVAKWWLPEDVAFVDAIPLTATGKLYKLELRKTFAEHFMR